MKIWDHLLSIADMSIGENKRYSRGQAKWNPLKDVEKEEDRDVALVACDAGLGTHYFDFYFCEEKNNFLIIGFQYAFAPTIIKLH